MDDLRYEAADTDDLRYDQTKEKPETHQWNIFHHLHCDGETVDDKTIARAVDKYLIWIMHIRSNKSSKSHWQNIPDCQWLRLLWRWIKKICPPLEKFCPLFKHFAQLRSILPRRWLILPTFKFRPGKVVFLGGVWGVLWTYISPKGVCEGWVKNRGWWGYSGQSETPSGQNETHLGNLYEKWAEGL